ncbi:cell wall-binding repeat-containing protein [Euzebya sp.]|uniref:cell wall-binding repeat-containing protein n=1 Tax=Euzebya sp. TaxID=1971409 RepID=UPI0035121B2C
MRRRLLALLAVLACTAALAPAAGAATTTTTDTTSIVKDDDPISNAEIAVLLSEATDFQSVDTVVIGRDDEFADSLASGVLQADSPLLLVPRNGPVPARVLAELTRLGPSRVILLGGESALAPAVADERAAEGFAVERRAGGSRFETAVAVAATDAPEADTVILARAFPSEGATDPTQGFADALAAGGMAAENRWPVLLTETERLTGSTRQHLLDAGIRQVEIMGGTAAISDAVEAEIRAMGITTERLAGPDRASTAAAVAEKRGAPTAADAAQVLLVEGQGADAWAGGFAAAAHSALNDAPIVLAAGDALPPATTAFLSGAGFAVDTDDVAGFPVLTCVTAPGVCEDARVALDLPPAVEMVFTPAEGAVVSSGQTVRVALPGSTASSVTAAGSCLAEPVEVPVSGGVVDVVITAASEGCGLDISVELPNGAVQTTTATYGVSDLSLVSLGADGTAAGGDYPAISADGSLMAFVSDGEVVEGESDGLRHVYAVRQTPAGREVTLVDVDADGQPAAAGITFSDGPPNVASAGYVVFTSPDTGLDPDAPGGGFLTSGYVHDLSDGSVELVSYDLDGTPISKPSNIDISDDGTVVSYRGQFSGASGFGILWHDRTTGETGAVTLPDGTPFGDGSGVGTPALSDDGSTIAFYTDLPLIDADTDEGTDVYTYEIASGTLEIASVATGGAQTSTEDFNDAGRLGISADGQVVVFATDATGLAEGDEAPDADVYVRDRAADQTRAISVDDAGVPTGGANRPTVSPDGSWAAFSTGAAPRGPGDGACGTVRVDLATGDAERVDVGPVVGANNCPGRVQVADDGSVLFDTISSFSLLDGEDVDPDVYLAAPAE